MYQDGDHLGYIGLKCLADEKTFEAEESRCEKGKVVDWNTTRTCPEDWDVPYCCQSGKPGEWGAATCLSKKDDCIPWKGDGTDTTLCYPSILFYILMEIYYTLIYD